MLRTMTYKDLPSYEIAVEETRLEIIKNCIKEWLNDIMISKI